MNHTIYIIDRAGQYRAESYLTEEEKNLAADHWESLAANVYNDRIHALLEYDRKT